MQLALYAENDGYYTKEQKKIGKAEDYYTSSSVNPVFAKTMFKGFLELYKSIPDYEKYALLEIGGGNGQFAYDLLEELKSKYPDIYSDFRYYLLELSDYNERLQKMKLDEHLDKLVFIKSLAELPPAFRGIIFGNELIDAFPVHRVVKLKGNIQEIYVGWNENKQEFVEEIAPISDSRIINYFKDVKIELREGQRAEVNLDVISWLEEVSKKLVAGYLMLVDYGHLADILYDSNRHAGSLICYYKHQANDNPYQLVGEQDITTHVNFSTLINEAQKQGFQSVYYNFQSNFLLNNQILEYFTEQDLVGPTKTDTIDKNAIKTNRAIRQLIAPDEMGETFKVIIFQKNVPEQSFNFQKNFWE